MIILLDHIKYLQSLIALCIQPELSISFLAADVTTSAWLVAEEGGVGGSGWSVGGARCLKTGAAWLTSTLSCSRNAEES